MAMIAPAKKSQVEFKLVESGTHIARIDQIIDLGVHTTTYKDKNGNNKQAHKIMIRFEIPGQKMENGSPMVISKDFNFSLGTLDGKYKSELRKFIESILGRDLTQTEVANFDIESLIGQVAMILIAHVPGVKDPSKKYAQITGAMKVLNGVPVPDAMNNPIIFSTQDFDAEIYNSFPEWLQKKIALPAGIDLNQSSNDSEPDTEELLA